MKVYISCDIEGTAALCDWNATMLGNIEHAAAAKEMTKETLACIEGCFEAGATEIYVKDAHDSARNMIFDEFPEGVKVLYGWSGHPDCMVSGIDGSFDAVLYIGWHAPAGNVENPLAHTMSASSYNYIKINDHFMSEYELHAMIAEGYGVPSVFLSGDTGICKIVRDMNENTKTAAVKEGLGGMVTALSSPSACKLIKEKTIEALKPENIGRCHITLPKHYKLEINYKKFANAYAKSFYPGAKLMDDKTTVVYDTESIEDFKVAMRFLSIG